MSNGNGSITITPNLLDTVTAASALLVATQAQAALATAAATGVTSAASTAVRNIFYGILSGIPLTRPDGSLSQDGDVFYNSSNQTLNMRVGGVWQVVAVTVTTLSGGTLLAGNNLADVSSIAAARSNLSLGSAALLNSGVAGGTATLDSGGHLPSGQFSAANMGVPLTINNLSEMNAPAIRSNLGLGGAALLQAGSANGVATLNAFGMVPMTQLNIAVANGLATLNSSGIVNSSQLPPGGIPTTQAKSTNYTSVFTDSGTVLAFTTGSSADLSCQLVAAATAGDGATMYIQKVDTGTKKVIVLDSNGTTNLAWLSNQWDFVGFRSNGSVWTIYRCEISPRIDIYTPGAATWTKPPLAATVFVELLSGGSSGGAGAACTSTSSGANGGTGGAGGGYHMRWFKAADLGSTENLTVGSGGAPSGNSGGNTSFGTIARFFVSGGGFGGTGGGLGGGSGAAVGVQAIAFEGAPSGGFGACYGGASGGVAGAATTGHAGAGSLFGGAGGGGGAGVDTGNGLYIGGAGGTTGIVTTGGGPGGGGTNTAGNPGSKPLEAGSGAGSTSGANGKSGGVGGLGAGGGGGGACTVGFGGGPGGAGGNGQAWITTYFAA